MQQINAHCITYCRIEQLVSDTHRFVQSQAEQDCGPDDDDDSRRRQSCAVTTYDANTTSEW